MRPTFDLQSHSIHSDGALPAADVIAHAASAGVELVALTDHDTVDGVSQARAPAPERAPARLPGRPGARDRGDGRAPARAGVPARRRAAGRPPRRRQADRAPAP